MMDTRLTGIIRTRFLSTGQKEQAIDDYLGGQNCTQIGKALGVNKEAIRGLLKRQGIPRRCKSQAMRRHQLDESVFDNPGPEGRYWLGFLMADGSVVHDRKTDHKAISLGLAAADAHHVEAFRSFLKTTATVRSCHRQASRCRGQDVAEGSSAYLTVSSQRLVTSLERYGIVPRKTFIARATDEMAGDRDFWRGVIDGDGSVCWCKAHGKLVPVLSLIGSEFIVGQFAAFVTKIVPGVQAQPRLLKHSPVWGYKVSNVIAKRLIAHLYQPDDFGLPRKVELAKDMIAWKPGAVSQLDPRQPRPVCAAAGCGTQSKHCGFCGKHYHRFLRYGSPDVVHKRGRRVSAASRIN